VATLVQDFFAALSTLAPAGGIWNMVNTAEAPVYEYIVFQRIVSTENNSLGGPSNLQNTRFQVDVIGRNYGAAAAIGADVRTALLAAFPSCVPLSGFDGYEDAVKAYRVSADYSIWATN
jgi:hypothetical protein